jgi:hypothetical protein
MMRKIGYAVLVAGLVVGVQSSVAAEKNEKKAEASSKPKAEAKKSDSSKGQAKLVTESEFARWLVQVLGLSRFLPAAPSDHECFAILLQNGIKPKDGWSADNTVTRGTLARVTVQAMGKVSEVKDPAKDESYIEYLRGLGIEIGTIGEAVETLEALDAPLANEALTVTTDPLEKVHRIRPVDEQQMGADLSMITRVFTEAVVPPGPPPMTPN